MFRIRQKIITVIMLVIIAVIPVLSQEERGHQIGQQAQDDINSLLGMEGAGYQSFGMKWIQKGIKKLFPNLMEIGWVADGVNILYQTGQLARITLQLVREYEKNYKALVETKARIEATYRKIDRLFVKFDPYDMSTWSETLHTSSDILMYDCQGVLFAWNNVNFVSATSNFIVAVDSLYNYGYRRKKNREVVKMVYYSSLLDVMRADVGRTMDNYADKFMAGLDEDMEKQMNIINNPLSKKADIKAAWDKVGELQNQQLMLGGLYYGALNHEDTLINFSRELMSMNLTLIQFMEAKIDETENAAGELLSEWYNMKDGMGLSRNMSYSEKEYAADTVKPLPKSEAFDSLRQVLDEHIYDPYYYDTSAYNRKIADPNRVPRPNLAKMVVERVVDNSKKKTVSYHDITQMQNMADFVLLRQDLIAREMAVLNAKTMAVIVAGKAYDKTLTKMDEVKVINDIISILDY